MSYRDRPVTAVGMGTRLRIHSPHRFRPLPPDVTPVNVPHRLDLIYTPAQSEIKAPSCSIHAASLGLRSQGCGFRDTGLLDQGHVMRDGWGRSTTPAPETAVMALFTGRGTLRLKHKQNWITITVALALLSATLYFSN